MNKWGHVSIGNPVQQWGELNVGGNIILDGTVFEYSDMRLKKDVENLDQRSHLENLKSINGISYMYISRESEDTNRPKGLNDTQKQYGFSAQQIQKIYPDLVIGDADKDYLAVNYIGFIPVLTEAIKEQQDEIESLKEVVKELKAANTKYGQEIEDLRKMITKH